MTEKTMTGEQLLEQARIYAIALGRDPAEVKTAEDAHKLFDRISRDCARWGSD